MLLFDKEVTDDILIFKTSVRV